MTGSRRASILSVVEPLDAVDPLALADSFARDLTPHAGNSMYWERPSDGFAIAGLGAATTLSAHGADRFATIDDAWRTLLQNAIVRDASNGAAGTGPTLMGGFAFDPDGPRSATWEGFASAQLTLPRFLVARTENGCWLTTNVVVDENGRHDLSDPELAAMRTRILGAAPRAAQGEVAGPGDTAIRWTDLLAPSAWRAMVASAVAAIHAGEMEKVVLARAVRATSDGARCRAGAIVRHLRSANPDAYVFCCWRGDRAFVGASPERLVRLDGREVLASSLAGSAARGATPEEDAWLAAQLVGSRKDAGEHAIVLRALRDGLAELCEQVSAAEEPSLLTLPHVHHLHTAVRARLRAGRSLLELVGRLHPTPAVGGTPRDAALAFIGAHEQLDRGWYAAPIGWMQRDRGEFAVALRSGVVDGSGAMVYAGCGVVGDSEPDLELAESMVKMRAMLSALAAAEGAHEPATETAHGGVTR